MLILIVKAQLVIISNNCPAIRKSEIEYYAFIGRTPVHHYTGSTYLASGFFSTFNNLFILDNVELGTACGKFFRSSVLSIVDAGTASHVIIRSFKPLIFSFSGDSDIIRNMPSSESS